MLTLLAPPAPPDEEVHHPEARPTIDGRWQPGCSCANWAARRFVDTRVEAQSIAERYHCAEANGEQVEP